MMLMKWILWAKRCAKSAFCIAILQVDYKWMAVFLISVLPPHKMPAHSIKGSNVEIKRGAAAAAAATSSWKISG